MPVILSKHIVFETALGDVVTTASVKALEASGTTVLIDAKELDLIAHRNDMRVERRRAAILKVHGACHIESIRFSAEIRTHLLGSMASGWALSQASGQTIGEW
jgi:hypothetical protein